MKKALVTGVSWDTGIGFAITEQLVRDGYYVYAVYHNEQATAKRVIEEKYQDSVKCLRCNLADRGGGIFASRYATQDDAS